MSYINPVLSGWNPDPSICRAGEYFYLATSTFMYFPAVPIYRSKNLVNWELIGHALDRTSQLDFLRWKNKNEIFAATLRFHDGVFYLITTDVGGIGNFFVTATDPAGPWSDPVIVESGLFDPSLFFDDDGKVYYTRRGRSGIVQAQIDVKSGRLLEPLREIARGFVSTDTEGPHLYKIRGLYYLLAGEGGSRYGHMATIGRSACPWGPFEPCPHNPILTQRQVTFSPIRDTGHAELVEDAAGKWWLIFLGTRNWTYSSFAHLGRETHLLPVKWDDNGWPLVGDSGLAAPELGGSGEGILDPVPLNSTLLDETDGWDNAIIHGRWITYRKPPSGAIRSGLIGSTGSTGSTGYGTGLHLACLEESLDSSPSPVMLARRLTAFDFEVEVHLRMDAPGKESEGDQTEAGLVLYLDSAHHYEIALRIHEASPGKETLREVVLCKRVGDLSMVAARHELDVHEYGIIAEYGLDLGISGCDELFRFRFRLTPDSGWKEIGTGLTSLLWPELASQWTGVVVGPYTCSQRSAERFMQPKDSKTCQYAHFTAWHYHETRIRWWKITGVVPDRILAGSEV